MRSRSLSRAMGEAHALKALCYVELNPVRAPVVNKACDYAWSSVAAHCGLGKGPRRFGATRTRAVRLARMTS